MSLARSTGTSSSIRMVGTDGDNHSSANESDDHDVLNKQHGQLQKMLAGWRDRIVALRDRNVALENLAVAQKKIIEKQTARESKQTQIIKDLKAQLESSRNGGGAVSSMKPKSMKHKSFRLEPYERNLAKLAKGSNPESSKRGRITAFVPPALPPLGKDVARSLDGKRFVLTGTFPELGGGSGIGLGKKKAEGIITTFGGKVTASIGDTTNYLLVGKVCDGLSPFDSYLSSFATSHYLLCRALIISSSSCITGAWKGQGQEGQR